MHAHGCSPSREHKNTPPSSRRASFPPGGLAVRPIHRHCPGDHLYDGALRRKDLEAPRQIMAAVLDRYRPFLEAHRPLSRRVRLHHIRASVSANGPAGVMTTLPCPAGYSWHRPAASFFAALFTSSEFSVFFVFV